APNCSVDVVSRRPGDKTHEVLISEEEAPYTEERDGLYVLRPGLPAGRSRRFAATRLASSEAEPFSAAELRRLVNGFADGGSGR
ncbi:MAG TPA: hypothetical protein VFD06_10105, partial [Candidatus Polarisedimenticolia bacterium]|nr:hypothetical protein [Candidatus Polarisedimenticolia bacterium]